LTTDYADIHGFLITPLSVPICVSSEATVSQSVVKI
jgi:hypothetical protein